MATTNMEFEKTKKNISKVKNVFKVAKIVSLTLMGLCFVLSLVALIFGPDVFKVAVDNSAKLTLVFKIFDVEVSNDLAEGISKIHVAGYSFGIGFAFGLFAIICEYIESIFKVIVEGESLFTEKALKKMKTGFILLAIFTLLGTSVLVAAVISLILWSIYTLFKYACALQKEADETL